MELILKREYNFDTEEIKEVLLKASFKKIMIFSILSLCILIAGIGTVIGAFIGGFTLNLFVCGLILIAAAIYYTIWLIRDINKGFKGISSITTYSYKFYDDQFVISYNALDSNVNASYRYEDVKKCRRNKKYIFIYLEKGMAPLKNETTDEELINFLKNKIKNFKE